jgi:hypothetical protein
MPLPALDLGFGARHPGRFGDRAVRHRFRALDRTAPNLHAACNRVAARHVRTPGTCANPLDIAPRSFGGAVAALHLSARLRTAGLADRHANSMMTLAAAVVVGACCCHSASRNPGEERGKDEVTHGGFRMWMVNPAMRLWT